MKGRVCAGSVQICLWLAQNIRKTSATQGKGIPHKMLRAMDSCLQKADISFFQSCQPSVGKLIDPRVQAPQLWALMQSLDAQTLTNILLILLYNLPASKPIEMFHLVRVLPSQATFLSTKSGPLFPAAISCHRSKLQQGDNPLQTRKAVIHSFQEDKCFLRLPYSYNIAFHPSICPCT